MNIVIILNYKEWKLMMNNQSSLCRNCTNFFCVDIGKKSDFDYSDNSQRRIICLIHDSIFDGITLGNYEKGYTHDLPLVKKCNKFEEKSK